MTNQEILEKAIQKAIDGGWDVTHFQTLKGNYKHPDESEFHDLLGDWHKISPFDVIFNHDFAKALWGEKEHKAAEYHKKRSTFIHPITKEQSEFNQDYITYDLSPGGWQYHLQQMVIADDPIKYLGENI